MPHKKNDIIYSAADIEKYHKGLLSPAEMHALEKAALDDPLLADALEGYGSSPVNISHDIADLRDRLNKRIKEEKVNVISITDKKSSFAWWRVAAMFVLIAGAALVVYQAAFNKKTGNIAQQNSPKEKFNTETKAFDSTTPTISQSDTVVNTEFQAAIQQDNKLKTKETDAATNLSKKDSSAGNGSALVKKTDDVKVSAPVANNAVPGLVTEKNSEELTRDDARRQYSDSVGLDKLRTKKEKEAQEFITYDVQQKRALAAQNRGVESLYKYQPNATNYRTNIFRGRVTDAQNNALPFSNITNTRDNVGTYADANGFFNLTSPDTVLNVRVSSIGFETSNVQLQNNASSNKILLQEDRNSLSEIVLSNKKPNSTRTRNSTMVLEEPEPADGWVNYDLYLANNLKEPDTFKEKLPGARGEVELSFEVNKMGEPVNITVKKSLCEACDKEAIRLVKEGPKWKRKAKKGKATVTVTF